MTRVRLFVLPFGHPATAAAEEGTPFSVDVAGDDDATRAAIRAWLVSHGYTVRSVNALAGARAGEPTYAATAVAPPQATGPGGDA